MVCPSCNTEIPDASRYCFLCGKRPPSATGGSQGQAGAEQESHALTSAVPNESRNTIVSRLEKLILDEARIKVTSARFIVKDTTYAMSGITSVKTAVKRPSKVGPLVTIVLGALGVLSGLTPSGGGFAFVGLMIALIGVLWFRGTCPTYTVWIATASGEKEAYENTNGAFVRKVVKAINDAIVHRG